jgi:hypothetical protein
MASHTPPTPERKCVVCDLPISLVCPGCRDANYCNAACQRADWEVHKLICKQLANFKDPPNPNFRRAVLLGSEHRKPTFAWVDYDANGNGEPNITLTFDGFPDRFHIVANPVRNRDLTYNDNNLMAYRSPSTYISGQPWNTCLSSILSRGPWWHGKADDADVR